MRSVVLGLFALAAACGPSTSKGGDDGGGGDDGSGSGSGSDDCGLKNGGDLSGSHATGYFDDDPVEYYDVFSITDQGDMDEYDVQLYLGAGVFADATEFPLNTAIDLSTDSDLSNCGACVTGTDGSDEAGNKYMAHKGTLTLTSTSHTTYAGTVTGAQLQHVHIDPDLGVQSVLGDGCAVSLSSWHFSVTPTMDPNGFAGRGVRLRMRR